MSRVLHVLFGRGVVACGVSSHARCLQRWIGSNDSKCPVWSIMRWNWAQLSPCCTFLQRLLACCRYVWVHRYKCVCPEDLLYRQNRLKKKRKVEKLHCFLVQELWCTKVRRVPSRFFMLPPAFRRGRTSVASCIAGFWIPCLCVLLGRGGFFSNLFVIEKKKPKSAFLVESVRKAVIHLWSQTLYVWKRARELCFGKLKRVLLSWKVAIFFLFFSRSFAIWPKLVTLKWASCFMFDFIYIPFPVALEEIQGVWMHFKSCLYDLKYFF